MLPVFHLLRLPGGLFSFSASGLNTWPSKRGFTDFHVSFLEIHNFDQYVQNFLTTVKWL